MIESADCPTTMQKKKMGSDRVSALDMGDVGAGRVQPEAPSSSGPISDAQRGRQAKRAQSRTVSIIPPLVAEKDPQPHNHVLGPTADNTAQLCRLLVSRTHCRFVTAY